MAGTILHLSASPKGERSASGSLARTFLTRYRERCPEDEVVERNLFDEPPAAFGREAAIAKFAPFEGERRSEAGREAWTEVKREIAALDAADKIVLSCPMWNYSVPWALKLYVDTIVQPGLTFGYDPAEDRHFGMLRNRPVQLILTRSSTEVGGYNDFQLSYLTYVLASIGLRDVRTVAATRTTNPDPDARVAYLASFDAALDAAAAAF